MHLEELDRDFITGKPYPLMLRPKIDQLGSLADMIRLVTDQRDELFAELCLSGALLFRGFAVRSLEDFGTLARELFTELRDYKGGDSPRSLIGQNIYSSTEYPPQLPISMHNEMSYSKRFPRFLLFFCQTAPQVGGATPLLDGRQMYRDLGREIIAEFASKKLTYVQNLHNGLGLGRSWQETFEDTDRQAVEARLVQLHLDYQWREDGSLRITETVDPVVAHPVTDARVFFSQADQWHSSHLAPEDKEALLALVDEEDFFHSCHFGNGTPLKVCQLEKIRSYAKREKVTFPWHRGDVLLVDNILTLHGRTPYSGARKILLAMG